MTAPTSRPLPGPALLSCPADRCWEVRSAGKGSKGERWYAWTWIVTGSPRHHLLVRRHRKTGELAFRYCYVPDGQLLTKTRLIRAAGLRWPAEEDVRSGKDCLGLDQCQVRLYAAILRHTVLVMAALAICAVTAAQLAGRTDTPAPAPAAPDQAPPPEPGKTPLTIPDIRRLLASRLATSRPPGHADHWLNWPPSMVGRLQRLDPSQHLADRPRTWLVSSVPAGYFKACSNAGETADGGSA